ncbi:hypothetical protein, partial [Ornithinimicrobium faecis]|uniref:hypothetical protein n=1 Tax=Ornithinimicrobium faecis TaxID=2934158 RepID=UPI003CE4CA01
MNNLAFVVGLLALAFGAIAWFRARKGRRGGKGLSVAAAVISVAAMAGVIATQAFYSDVIDEVERSISDASDDQPAESDDSAEAANVAAPVNDEAEDDQATEDEQSAESAQDEATADETAAEPEEATSGVLGLGAAADVGEYAVAVTDVQLNANDAVKAANDFNDDPTGQYVLVSLDVTYNGDEEGDPWLDLMVELAGSDARIYDSTTCSAVTPNSDMDVPTLTTGGTGTFDICFDVPAEALDNPQFHVEESLSFADTRVTWGMEKADAADIAAPAKSDGPEQASAQPPADALEMGATADVGEYAVTVTDVQLNANDAVKAANDFNDDPTGQYVLVSLDVTYNGDEEGDPWLDLMVELAGSDARIYDSTTCSAVTPNSDMDVPTLTTGGTGTFD